MNDQGQESAREKIKNHRSFNVLCLDGGGIRGTVEAVLLDRIKKQFPLFLRNLDLIVGVSNGGIQALSLAADRSPEATKEIYEKGAKFIFSDSLWEDVEDLRRAKGADYSNDNLKNLLKLQFGDMRLRDLYKRIAILAFDLDNNPEDDSSNCRAWQPRIFHNFPGINSDGDERVVDIALRTSAAPIFFPTYQGYCDGGVSANNPCMVGLAQALDPKTGNSSIDQIKILSIGAGKLERYIEGDSLDWGAAQWAPHFIYMMLDGAVDMASFQCGSILGDRFHRISPKLKDNFSLDAWEKVSELVKIAENVDLEIR